MTDIKIQSKLSSNASIALEGMAGRLFSLPGVRIVGIVELAHVERTQPAPDEEKKPSVTLAIKSLEIARDEQEHHIRQAMRALYLNRTASGTLDEDSHVELSERTLELTAGTLHAVEAARLRAVVANWRQYAEQAQQGNLTREQLRDELKAIGDGLRAALAWVEAP